MTNIKILGISLVVATAISFSGCGSSSDDTTIAPPDNNTITTKKYNGAGSRWDLSFKSDGNATIKELDSNLEINATWEDLDSGFRKITTTSSSDSNIVNGTTTYGFELPDYMFPFVAFRENKLVPTVIKGENFSSAIIKHNYILSYGQSSTSTAEFDKNNFLGYWIGNNNNHTLKVVKLLLNGTQFSNNTYNFNLTDKINNNGKWSEDEDEKRVNYITASGGLIYHVEAKKDSNGNNSSAIWNFFMIPYEANLNSINQIDGKYIGYVISGNGQSSIGYTNTPISVTATNGALELKDINVTSGVVGNKISDISLTTKVTGTKGLWIGQITTVNPSGTEGIGCAIDLDAGGSGKNVIICGGMLPDGSNKKLYSVILVSK